MPQGEEDIEIEWASRARGGDREAFGRLVERHMRRAYASALGLTGSPEDAMDISQEAFVKAYRSMGRFEAGRPFFPWYYKILRNLCFNHLRDRARRGRLLRQAARDGLVPASSGFAPSPEALVHRSEVVQSVWAALGGLREEEREVLVLREIDGRSYKEIAELAGCPIGTVMSRLFAARRNLRSALDGEMH